MVQEGRSILARIFLAMIGFYRSVISPVLPPLCRFEPTCSCYASEAIRNHGAIRGLGLTAARLVRCHPFSRGGYDPVPAPKE